MNKLSPLFQIFLSLPLIGAGAMLHGVPVETEEGFRIPQPGAVLTFPRDHGNHPAFKIEWWYLTGHLFAESGQRFGYQATFFRSALKAPEEQSPGPFSSSQLYLTHMALIDESGKAFHFDQRLSREGWDAGSSIEGLEVQNGNWSLKAIEPDASLIKLQASVASDVRWSLNLRHEKPLLRFGQDGTSRKGPAPAARSYYLTFSRIATSGTVTIDGRTVDVTGESWMDHEIASSQLDPSYTGWDWIAIQLTDGWEIKAYLLRQADGSPSPFSALIWIDPDGQTFYREVEDFQWEKNSLWKSDITGATYPIRPVIKTRHPMSGEAVEFHFEPLIENQELTFPGSTYWEGAGRIKEGSGETIGSAYLELVGYAGAIEGLR